MRRVMLWAALAAWAVGCDDGDPSPDGGSPEAGVDGALDAAGDVAPDDAAPDGAAVDAGGDGAPPDARVDGGAADVGPDVGSVDAAAGDAAPGDGGPDAAPVDVGPVDAMVPDAMAPDAMVPDAMAPMACDHPRSACRVDADCGPGRCTPLPDDPAAPCICVGPRPAPVQAFCDPGGPFESECCADADCAAPPGGEAVCMQSVYGPQNDYCGGAAPPEENTCRVDGCRVDTDCAGGEVCVPAGAFGYVVGACRPAPCRVDADCAARPGGECRPYFARCVSASMGCSYADSPCRVDADCPLGRFGDRMACVPGAGGDTACREILPAP